MTDTKYSKGFAQISIEEYDRLKANDKLLAELVNSDKCLELSSLYSYERYGAQFIINPPPDFKELVNTLKVEQDLSRKRYWSIKNINKRITPFDIGKKLSSVIK